ncbi:MAG TPA: GNAT family N-acetyltransferase [Terriglobia bacterium]|nr:GNAT family N-acetyltransferase [Terriglobia bacterium]
MRPQIRLMTPADVSAGMRLKEIAGWNQTEEDWQRFLDANPDGCFVAECDEQVAGTVATIIYGSVLAWIGMVLVDRQFRGRGIGTALLTKALDYLDGRQVACVKLDATPEGRPIYEHHGFQVEYAIERCVLKRSDKAGTLVEAPEAIRNTDSGWITTIDGILTMDRKIFGADRGALLKSVASAAPEFVIAKHRGSHREGYGLGRKGSRADHLGPWVASSALAAREILDSFLARSQRNTVFVDVVKDNAWAPALLVERGFQTSRSLTRMYRGPNRCPGEPERVCAILGPEFG